MFCNICYFQFRINSVKKNLAVSTNKTSSLLLKTSALDAVILIRLLLGPIFVSEGIQKFLFPAELGIGRFGKLSIVYPSFSAPFVGVVEIACGILLLVGLLTRFATIPLLIIMCVAIFTTKFNVLVVSGFWKFAHEARTDYSMIMCLIFLLLVGSGSASFDNEIIKKINKV